MIGYKNIHVGVVYAFVHFALEVACFQYLYMLFRFDSSWWIAALAYDALAFVPQCVIGILCDRNQKFRVGTFGGTLVVTALLLSLMRISVLWWIGLVILAIGNSCIHISGAIATMTVSEGKLSHIAIFVAGGAFGVIAGRLLGTSHSTIFISIFLTLIAMILMRMTDKYWIVSKGIHIDRKKCIFDIAAEGRFELIILLTFFVVAIRSVISYGIPLAWNQGTLQTIALFSCMGIGKALGGIFSDQFDARKVALISSCLSLPFILCGNHNMYISLIGITLFSMTMPITLGILASKINESPGLAFGITTIGLFFGTIVVSLFKISNELINGTIITLLTVAAVAALQISLKKKEKLK